MFRSLLGQRKSPPAPVSSGRTTTSTGETQSATASTGRAATSTGAIVIRMSHAQLVLISSARRDIRTDGPAVLSSGHEGISIVERLPALEIHPVCRVEVPDGSTVELQSEGGDLTAYQFKGNLRARLIEGQSRIDKCEGQFRVVSGHGQVVVEHVRGSADVLTSTGNVAARDVQGDLQVVSDAGLLTFDNIDGSVAARTTTGSIDASDLKGTSRLSTRSGGVKVADVYRQLTVRTQSGDIELNSSIIDHTTLETFKGRVEVQLGPRTDARVEATAKQGIVRSERLALQPGSSRRLVRGIVGEGRVRLKASTGMGVIEIIAPAPWQTKS